MADLHDMLIYKALGGGGSSTSVVPLTVTENGTYTAEEGTAYSPVTVNVSGGGGGGSVDSGVIFIDYDGSIVTSWQPDEVASKTALPDNPSHTGLIAQGWNWSLANIKSYISKYEGAKVVVGQMYETASGLTEIDITVTKVTGLSVTCNMVGNKDWGDGTEDSLTSHTYTDYGDYTITCDGTSIPGTTSSKGALFDSTSSNMNRFWCKAIRIGSSVTSVGRSACYHCESLRFVTMPNSITELEGVIFDACVSLLSITVPNSTTDAVYMSSCFVLKSAALQEGCERIADSAFNNCRCLTFITVPDSVTVIGNSAFTSCYSLTSVVIPDKVTTVGDYCFYYCYSLIEVNISERITALPYGLFWYCNALSKINIHSGIIDIGYNVFSECTSIFKYDFSLAKAIPTLRNVNAFNRIKGICKIIVPDALYDTWIAATNWATYADYIYKASEVE